MKRANERHSFLLLRKQLLTTQFQKIFTPTTSLRDLEKKENKMTDKEKSLDERATTLHKESKDLIERERISGERQDAIKLREEDIIKKQEECAKRLDSVAATEKR